MLTASYTPVLVGQEPLVGPVELGDPIGTISNTDALAVGSAFLTVALIHAILRPVSAVIAGIHGYRRHDEDVGAAVGWGALGFFFPIITPTVALIQGYGKPMRK
jgi:hypothetical protein